MDLPPASPFGKTKPVSGKNEYYLTTGGQFARQGGMNDIQLGGTNNEWRG
jgi:hypothetical protein